MSFVSPELFSRILSPASAQTIIKAQLEQKVANVVDDRFLALDFDLRRFFEILRDRTWRSDKEIEFYAHARQGRSHDIWPTAIQPNGVLTLDSIMRLKAQKTSIYVQDLQNMAQPLRELARDLTATGYFSCRIYALYSPANAQSTSPHLDLSDVLALQLCGSKSWTIDSEPQIRNFGPARPDRLLKSDQFVDPVHHTVNPGEALFVPRGFLHKAESTDEESLHLVIAINPMTWLGVVNAMLSTWALEQPDLMGSVLQADEIGQPVSSFETVAALLSHLSDPEKMRAMAEETMKAQGRRSAVHGFGQLFAGDVSELISNGDGQTG